MEQPVAPESLQAESHGNNGGTVEEEEAMQSLLDISGDGSLSSRTSSIYTTTESLDDQQPVECNVFQDVISFFTNIFCLKKHQRHGTDTVKVERQLRAATDATTSASPVAPSLPRAGISSREGKSSGTHSRSRNATLSEPRMETTSRRNEARRESQPINIGHQHLQQSEDRSTGQQRRSVLSGSCESLDTRVLLDEHVLEADDEELKEDSERDEEAMSTACDGEQRENMFKQGSFFDEDYLPTHDRSKFALQPDNFKSMVYLAPDNRVRTVLAPPSTVARPNYQDALRRVAVILYQHTKTCEYRKLCTGFSARECHAAVVFDERNFTRSDLRYQFFSPPWMALPGLSYIIRKIPRNPEPPTVERIFEFTSELFHKACMSSECSLVCLIYVERLMDMGNVPLIEATWKPIVLCSLLLASKMWQDVGSYNGEFAAFCPEFSPKGVNRLESLYIQQLGWDLNVSGSLYAQYYFAVRSLAERKHSRRRYNQLAKINSSSFTSPLLSKSL